MEFLRMLESIRSPFLDTVFGLITRLGEETIAIVVLCAIFWCISKRAAYGIGIAYFLSGLTVQGMKIIFRIERPWIADPTLNPVHSALDHATGYSFPSGHTQSATALLGALGAQVKQTPVKVTLFLFAVLVAFSRMYLGVHTPLDVTVSLLVTLLLVFLAVKFFTGAEVDRK
ncbi:MAG: phosphatase PAP2 family protein, partial [Treponema sp.]|nr:phosphatase PAP2 family protein [Treponema sp.]